MQIQSRRIVQVIMVAAIGVTTCGVFYSARSVYKTLSNYLKPRPSLPVYKD